MSNPGSGDEPPAGSPDRSSGTEDRSALDDAPEAAALPAPPVEGAENEAASVADEGSDDGEFGSTWHEYLFDADDVAIARDLIDAAAPDASELEVSSRISAAGHSGSALKGTLVREVSCAFLYRLDIDRGNAAAPGARLEPQSAAKNGFLRPIDQLTDDVLLLLEALVDQVASVRAAGRLHDLLFTARRGDIGGHGRSAIANYLAAQAHATDHDRVELLLRTWTLSRQMRRADDEHTARLEMWSLLKAHASQDGGGAPGVTLPLLTALLASVPPSTTTTTAEPDADAMLADLAAKYTQDYLVDRISVLQRARAGGDAAALAAIDRQRVQARLDRADAVTVGHLRMHFLGAAAALARDLGVTDLADLAVTEMQKMKPEELEWIHFTASAAIPTDVFEGVLRTYDQTGDWRDGLATWIASAPPSGRYQDNVRAARKAARASVLRHFFGSTTFGSHGLPQKSSAAGTLDRDVRQYEQNQASHQGELLAIALDRVRAIGPEVTTADLSEWVGRTYGCDMALASRFARALMLFWEERFDEAAHTAAPAIEAGARSLLRELDEPLYRVEKGNTIGQFPGLGALLPRLHARGLEKSWQRFLETVLLPEGYNLRNVLAHGLTGTLGRLDAVLILRATALFVPLVEPTAQVRDAVEVESMLRTAPPAPPRTFLRRVQAAARAAAWELRRPT